MMMMSAIIFTCCAGHAATRYTHVSTCHMGQLELVGIGTQVLWRYSAQ